MRERVRKDEKGKKCASAKSYDVEKAKEHFAGKAKHDELRIDRE
jgi:hypothetical protein